MDVFDIVVADVVSKPPRVKAVAPLPLTVTVPVLPVLVPAFQLNPDSVTLSPVSVPPVETRSLTVPSAAVPVSVVPSGIWIEIG